MFLMLQLDYLFRFCRVSVVVFVAHFFAFRIVLVSVLIPVPVSGLVSVLIISCPLCLSPCPRSLCLSLCLSLPLPLIHCLPVPVLGPWASLFPCPCPCLFSLCSRGRPCSCSSRPILVLFAIFAISQCPFILFTTDSVSSSWR